MTKKADIDFTNSADRKPQKGLADISVTVLSFGYKEGIPPEANIVFDVRFLKNPYWIDELRPLTGKDQAVQDYVLNQTVAKEFLASISELLIGLLPKLKELNIADFSIAFGCTGGQHRSATLAEALSKQLASLYPEANIKVKHRELESCNACASVTIAPESVNED